MKQALLIAVTIMLTACASVSPRPADNASFEWTVSEEFGIEVPVPAWWEAGEYPGGITSYDIRSLNNHVVLKILILGPPSTGFSDADSIAQFRAGGVREGLVFEPISRTIDGIQVQGLVTVGRDPEKQILLIHHPLTVYLVVMEIQEVTTPEERAQVFYILDHMKLNGVELDE